MKTLTLTKLAKYLDVDKRTLYRMINDDRFPVKPIKGTNPRLWNSEVVDRWINNK